MLYRCSIDSISHLADSEEIAAQVIAGTADLSRFRSAPDLNALRQEAVKIGRKMRPQDVIEWWRGGRAKVVEPLSHMRASDRVEWIEGTMSARTLATTRLMETWAHGLDIKAAILGRMTPLEEPPEEDEAADPLADTARLRHIAALGQRTLPFAFAQAGLEYPEKGIRVEVMGPLYAAWRYGPEDTDQVIKGMAGDWCRLVVQRVSASETGLKAVGEDAETALTIARAY